VLVRLWCVRAKANGMQFECPSEQLESKSPQRKGEGESGERSEALVESVACKADVSRSKRMHLQVVNDKTAATRIAPEAQSGMNKVGIQHDPAAARLQCKYMSGT
jgi:hypothetical protein